MTLRYHTPLSPEEQQAHGLTTPQTMALADKVRFSELDNQNHVNNKAYLSWFETVRVIHFNQVCAPFFPAGIRPRIMIHSLALRYHKEMRLGEDYICTAQVVSLRTRSYTLEQQVWSGDLRAAMQVVVVLDRPDGSGRWALPGALRAHLVTHEGATQA